MEMDVEILKLVLTGVREVCRVSAYCMDSQIRRDARILPANTREILAIHSRTQLVTWKIVHSFILYWRVAVTQISNILKTVQSSKNKSPFTTPS